MRSTAIEIASEAHYPGGALSNFCSRSFALRGLRARSMEGLLQALKCPDPAQAREIMGLAGVQAKKAGRSFDWRSEQRLFWMELPLTAMAPSIRRFSMRLSERGLLTTCERVARFSLRVMRLWSTASARPIRSRRFSRVRSSSIGSPESASYSGGGSRTCSFGSQGRAADAVLTARRPPLQSRAGGRQLTRDRSTCCR